LYEGSVEIYESQLAKTFTSKFINIQQDHFSSLQSAHCTSFSKNYLTASVSAFSAAAKDQEGPRMIQLATHGCHRARSCSSFIPRMCSLSDSHALVVLTAFVYSVLQFVKTQYPNLTYYWSLPLILDHPYLVGK
jgi:hypothetical protein